MKLFFNQIIRASEVEDALVVQCRDSGVVLSTDKWELDKPVKFQWMPGGVTTINAHYGNKSIELTVHADEAAAKAVQASYENWFNVRPKLAPFGCIEHKEQDAALRLPKGIAAFEWCNASEGKDAGIYCTATPTETGATLVNGRTFNSWSPSFTTDAEYNKAKEVGGRLVFAKGARGSRENPARVTGCAFSVGSLTNKPAFRNINPVKAKEGEIEEQEEAVKAAGTSEGVKKGWESRKHHLSYPGSSDKELSRKAAMSASREAFEADALMGQASSHADRVGTEASHKFAEHASNYASFTHHAASEALDAHQNTHGYDAEMAQAGAEHRGKRFARSDWAKRHSKLAKGEVKCADTTPETPSIYATLAPDQDKLKSIYAELAEPEDPNQKLYASILGGGNG